MRKILCIILLVFAPILAIGAEDKAYSIESVPNVYAQDRRLHVSDPNGLLMQETQAEINRMLTLLEDSTGIQSMVVMLPSIGQEDIFDFAHNLFRHWGIGNKESNNGMLIVYVADQRKIRFTTGYGLEGILPDAMCKRIQSRYMIPHFREGNTDLGMLEGTKAVVSVLDGSMKADNTEEQQENPLTVHYHFKNLFRWVFLTSSHLTLTMQEYRMLFRYQVLTMFRQHTR